MKRFLSTREQVARHAGNRIHVRRQRSGINNLIPTTQSQSSIRFEPITVIGIVAHKGGSDLVGRDRSMCNPGSVERVHPLLADKWFHRKQLPPECNEVVSSHLAQTTRPVELRALLYQCLQLPQCAMPWWPMRRRRLFGVAHYRSFDGSVVHALSNEYNGRSDSVAVRPVAPYQTLSRAAGRTLSNRYSARNGGSVVCAPSAHEP